MNRKRNYFIYSLVLMALLAALAACNPTPVAPTVSNEPVQEEQEPALVESEPTETVVDPIPAKPTSTAVGEKLTAETDQRQTQLDAVDTQLFERTAQLFDLFRTQSDQIWNSDYRLDQMPIMYVLSNGFADQYAYLINHPNAADLDGAQLIQLPAELNLPAVYRYDQIPNAARIAQSPNFDFNAPVDGVETYVMKYTKPEVDQFSSPVSHDWSLFVAHEGLHDDQAEWRSAPDNGQNTAGYPLEADHIALIMLETEVLKAALTAEDDAGRDQAIKQFVAIRQERINRWDSVRLLDLPQEQMEGTARYIEHSLGSLLGYDRTNLTTFAESIYPVPESRVRETLAFGRFYETGAALTHLVDQVGINDWTKAIENGQSQFDLLADHYDLSDSERVTLLDQAKVSYRFEEISQKAKPIAETAASEPTDIWGEVDHSDTDFPTDGQEGDEIVMEDVFPQKPYATAPDNLVFKQAPSGYELQGGYVLDANEITESFISQLYSPQQNEIQVVDWTNNMGELLRLTSSKGNYSSLDEIQANMPQFGEAQVEEIAGNQVIINDFSDDQFTFSVANVLLNDQYVVIEGAITYDEMVALVTDLLTG